MGSATGAMDKNDFQPGAWHFAALLGGNAALAIGPWFVRLADTGPVSLGFWRLLLPLPILLLLARRESSGQRLDRRRAMWIAFAGIAFALDLVAWHIGIHLTRLGNSVLLANSGSLFLMIWGLFQLRRAPHANEAAAIVAALAGGAILLGRSFEISPETLVGDLLCLTAGAFYVLYLIPAQRARQGLGQWTVLSLVSIAGAPVLLAIALAAGEPVLPGAAGWLPVVAMATTGQLVGQALIVYSLRHFPPLIIGLALLTQPALAALVGWLAFRETLAPADFLGMGLVAAALLIAKLAEPRAAAPRRR
ncbi:DMT family transporter [Erythrobacter mangrovi]|uniref:DMT family transporter n=1 Tax=Erythrobacter mangrovi TaxID=2739433 RepID=A0A7D3XCV4_9SPHN|nr:DMT family transporter [Erythrobacter mangrovi]QKG72060.1 DMT family transporter [Erythrobacter mangrovi]